MLRPPVPSPRVKSPPYIQYYKVTNKSLQTNLSTHLEHKVGNDAMKDGALVADQLAIF